MMAIIFAHLSEGNFKTRAYFNLLQYRFPNCYNVPLRIETISIF